MTTKLAEDEGTPTPADTFHKMLFQLQPHEVVYPLFDYFAAALESAPQQKLDEFFVHFRTGIIEAIEHRKNRRQAGDHHHH